MMRSMYSGVAGLKTHQTKMDVIGNNIANVNTVAYKSQSVTFSELMYQTTQNASGANPTTGTAGINARQIGLGVKTGAINTAISSQGASQTTNNPFDIRITGSAFFIVSNMQDTFFTRDGSFYVDGIGNLAMTSNGYNVMGWQVDPETMDIKQDTVSPLRVMSAENMTYEPEATTKGRVTGIIDKLDTQINSSAGKIMNFMFYDKLGYPYTAKFTVKSTDDDGVYSLQLNSILDADNNVVAKGDVAAGDGFTANKAGTVALSDAYKWGTGTNAGKLFAATDTTFTTPIQVGDTPADISLSDGISDDEWEFLAKAYNYSSVSEFMSTGFKVTDPGDATKTISISMTDYLTNKSIDITGGSKGAIDLVQGNTSATALTLEALNNKADSQTIVFDGSVSVTYDPATGKFTGIGGADNPSITLALSEIKAPEGGTDSNFEDIEIDFSTTTMFNNSGTSTISASSGDANKLGTGRKLGRMSGISIQDDGRIYASYDNGMSRLLGQIAVAEFANASGLEKEGDNLYKNTQNSGDFDGIGIDIKSGGGYMTTGVLEMSNVDLSAEFTDMITTQRGFQANSRIITVSDTLLEELVNLKR
ncbi:MAG: flagellar hook-basal body complex protein [Lachnospiraceae bacterium]|nr:flagellar hook-basal body complex protein [Lachnospiraceae bacterium]